MVRNWESLLISLIIAFLALLLLMVVTLVTMLRQHRRFRRQMLLQAGEITHLSEDERSS